MTVGVARRERSRRPRSRAWRSGGVWFLLLNALACAPRSQGPAPTPAQPSPTPRAEEARPAPRPAFGTITGPAGALAYRIVGSGADTLLIPMGAYVEEGLSSLGRDRTLIFVDTRGRGRSARLIDTTARTFMGDVTDLEVVRAEFRLSKMTLVGWSYAAAVVARYAADHPEAVNKVIMLSPMEPTDSLLQAHMRRVDREALARIDTVKARQLVRWRGAGRDTSDAEAYCRLYWEVNGPMYVADARAAATIKAEWCTLPNEHVRTMGAHVTGVMSSLGSAWDLRLAAGRIRAPVLIVHGERDMVASPDGARAWARAIPGAKLVSVPGAGHLWWVDAPRRVVQEIESFLR